MIVRVNIYRLKYVSNPLIFFIIFMKLITIIITPIIYR